MKLIFVVDDEDALVEVVGDFLKSRGFRVVMFTSPEAALIAAASTQPDLLLSDFRMDGMDGLSLATSILALCPNCRVLLMSAVLDDKMCRLARNEIEFLQKPVQLPLLLAKIRSVLE